MKNWKTSLGGIFASVGLILSTNDEPLFSGIGKILEGAGLLLLGLGAKDHNVTGGKP